MNVLLFFANTIRLASHLINTSHAVCNAGIFKTWKVSVFSIAYKNLQPKNYRILKIPALARLCLQRKREVS